ncbi:MAG: hypothetical protein PUB09_02255 [Firmicutes bacterium]|nr:hypothetical protein [Bacillota bacterium]
MELVRNGDMDTVKEVAYLLSQQFMGRLPILENTSLEITEEDGEKIYTFDAGLEVGKRRWGLKPGQYVYPARIADHRLYVKDDKKRELGYLSFADDRLYYGLIPIFERRAAKLRMKVLDNVNKLMVDINSAIDDLLRI